MQICRYALALLSLSLSMISVPAIAQPVTDTDSLATNPESAPEPSPESESNESQPHPTPEWQLIWSDEFDTPGRPDPEKWGFERGFVRNRELQWYQPENAFQRDGKLVIQGRRETKPLEEIRLRGEFRGRQQIEYTSASLNTRRTFTWQYGRLEVRAKIRAEPGLWPAIWTLGVRGGWPEKGEVDLMEYYQGGILANAAWRGPDHQTAWDSSTTPVDDLGDDWDQHYHTWRMDWNEQHIRLSVDDRLLNQIDLDEIDYIGDRHPFRQPHYLLLNLAIGGTQGGDPSKTEFPTEYLIDYVRIYQPAP